MYAFTGAAIAAFAVVPLRVFVIVGLEVDVFCLVLLVDIIRLFGAVDDEFVGVKGKGYCGHFVEVVDDMVGLEVTDDLAGKGVVGTDGC